MIGAKLNSCHSLTKKEGTCHEKTVVANISLSKRTVFGVGLFSTKQIVKTTHGPSSMPSCVARRPCGLQ